MFGETFRLTPWERAAAPPLLPGVAALFSSFERGNRVPAKPKPATRNRSPRQGGPTSHVEGPDPSPPRRGGQRTLRIAGLATVLATLVLLGVVRFAPGLGSNTSP